MRVYLELVELVEEGLEEADFIRIDVTEWSGKDVDEAVELLKEHSQVYAHCVVQLHYCYHDEGGPCRVEVVYSK